MKRISSKGYWHLIVEKMRFKSRGSSVRVGAISLLAVNVFLIFSVFGGSPPMDDDYGKVRIVLEAGDYSITRDDRGFDMIMMEGFASTASPGNPMLVHRVYNILVPPDAVLEDLKLEVVSSEIVVLDEAYEIRPVGPAAPVSDKFVGEEMRIVWGDGKNIVDGRNLDVYERDADYPENFVELLTYSEMRKWKFARVDFTPFQYNPVTKTLTLIKSAVVEISYEISPAPLDRTLLTDTVMDDVARDLFINYDEGRIWYEEMATKAEPLSSYDYVIITTNAIVANSERLNAFTAHKRSFGYNVLVVTEDDFLPVTGQAPNNRAEKIRQWLKNNYISMGIDYVLLIGDPRPHSVSFEGDIPMKKCHLVVQGDEYEIPTDYFYADLTGNWDINNNQKFGELADFTTPGGVDLTAEVYVGRIPVYDADYAALDGILKKIIDYETSLNTGWRKSALLPKSFLDGGVYGNPATDYAGLGEQMKNDYFIPSGFSYWRMYQQGSGACGVDSAYDSEQELRGGTWVRDRWASNDFGIVSWGGHGNPTQTAVGYEEPAYCIDGLLFESSYSSALNDQRPSFVFHGSCSNAHPETKNNIAYSVLKKGGISTLGSTRVCWYTYGQSSFAGSATMGGIGYEYVKRLVQELPGGDALYQMKQTIYPSQDYLLMNWYDFNLYGDPSVSLKNPAPPTGWFGLGGYSTSLPSMIVDDQGRTHIFVRGGDGALWDNIDGVWYRLGGGISSAPFAVKDNYGRIHVLARGDDSALWDLRFDTGAWSASWYYMGGCIAEMPTATQYWGTGSIAIMTRACDDSLWALDLVDPAGMSGYWINLGGIIRGVPYVMEDANEKIHTFSRGGDNALWDHVIDSQGSFNWYYLGGGLSTGQVMPTAVNQPGWPGYVAVMVRAPDNALWMCDLWPDMSPHWFRLGGVIGSGGYAVTDSLGRIHTFAKGADGAAWENVFSSSPWNPSGAQWHYQGGVLHSMAWHPVALANGYTHMVVVGSNSALYKKVYTTMVPSIAPTEEDERTRIESELIGPQDGSFSGEVPREAIVAVEIPAEIVLVDDEDASALMAVHGLGQYAVDGVDARSVVI